MLQYKTKITILGALAVTSLMNFPRLLITLRESELIASFGLTLGDVFLRSVVMFCFALLVLSFNLSWKNKWLNNQSRNRMATDIAMNGGILILGLTTLTLLKQVFSSGFQEKRPFFFIALFSYLIVHFILLLVARLVNLNFQHQQNIIEKEQAKQKTLQHQLQALRTQINPHFLFNALNSLNALIRQKSDKASTFVDKLSLLLRSTLQRSDKDFITIQDELDYLENYMYLQKERFGDKFNVDIQIPEEWTKELIPSFSLQLLVENAIKHNVISKKQPLSVEIYTEGSYLVVRNLLQERRDSVESTETGLSNLSTRFNLLKKRRIQIIKDKEYFSVKLPILNDESSNY